MSKKGPPKIRTKKGKDHTKVSFSPDLAKFGLDCLTKDMVGLLTRRVYDVAGTVNCNVHLNGTRLPIKYAVVVRQWSILILTVSQEFP